jgi:hypothetical protein
MASPPVRARRLAGLAGATLIVIALSFALALRRPGSAGRVLVLPLTNETGDTSLTALGRMTADWVMEGLSGARLADLVDYRMLLTHDEAESGLNAQRALRLARAARADRLVRGALYRIDDSLAVQVQLVQASDGELLGRPVGVVGVASHPGAVVEAARQRVMGLQSTVNSRQFSRKNC